MAEITKLIGQLRTALIAEPISRANNLALTKLDELEMWAARAEHERAAKVLEHK